MIQFIYTFLLYPLLYAVFLLLSLRNEKVREGLRIRRGRSWIQDYPAGTKWVWFHVASGELEYAKPVIRELKKLRPDVSVLVTFFSPSVIRNLQRTKEIDLFVPMPWDTPWHWRQFLNHYKPRLLAIARTDTWPNMVWETKKSGVPSVLFAATLPRHSGRYASFFGRLLYGRIVEDLSLVSCVTEEDQDNFQRLHEELHCSVDGDTRFDQVIARIEERRPLPALVAEGFTPAFVMGSTWPEDEAVLLPALKKPAEAGLHAIIAPHEPTEDHIVPIETKLGELGLSSARYSKLGSADLGTRPQVVIVDQIGVLADLYRVSQIAFVGGSFKKSVHSVMEPAAAGNLTLVGPFHFNSREALALKERGMVKEVVDSKQVEELLLGELHLSATELDERQARILSFVNSNKGVSRKVAEWIGSEIARI